MLFYEDYQYLILIDNIFAMFGGGVFRQIVGIHMGANCDPLLPDYLVICKCAVGFMHGFTCKTGRN